MWGGFDLSATRYRAVAVDPPAGRPVFQQNGMAEEVVALGFALPDKESPDACFYGYIAPEPPGVAERHWALEQASWQPEAGLAVLPWDAARRARDPRNAVISFADAVYDAAVSLAGWPAHLTGTRVDGWTASRQRIS